MRSQTIEMIDQRAAHVHLEHAGLHQREQAVEVLDGDDLPFLAVDHGAQALLGQPGRGVLLEEALTLGAVGAAHQRERPVHDVRRHPVPDRAVIVGQILLGDADVGPIDAVGMGEPHVALFPRFGARCGRTRMACRPLVGRVSASGRLRGLLDFFAMTFVALAATLAASARSSDVFASCRSRPAPRARLPRAACPRARP